MLIALDCTEGNATRDDSDEGKDSASLTPSVESNLRAILAPTKSRSTRSNRNTRKACKPAGRIGGVRTVITTSSGCVRIHAQRSEKVNQMAQLSTEARFPGETTAR